MIEKSMHNSSFRKPVRYVFPCFVCRRVISDHNIIRKRHLLYEETVKRLAYVFFVVVSNKKNSKFWQSITYILARTSRRRIKLI